MNKTPRILLVDDDEVQLQVIAHAVQSFSDYAVLTASSAATAMPLAVGRTAWWIRPAPRMATCGGMMVSAA